MSVQRYFITGDEWLYYKIYCGEKTAENILSEVIKTLSNEFLNKGLIDKWFFIRYTDPDFHLRWRLLMKNKNEIGKLILMINKLLKIYVNKRQIYEIQTATYKRELERYGNNTMELSETIFWYDSKMVVDFLDMIEGDEGEKIRWLFGMLSIDQLLDDFKFTTQQKFDLIKTLADNFGKEFNLNSSLIIQLSDKYRKEKSDIFRFLNRENDSNSEYLPLFELLKIRSQKSGYAIEQILTIKNNASLQLPFNNLISSYIHMMMNRLFRSKNRLHEMVIYGFLFRYYRSQLARIKYAKQR